MKRMAVGKLPLLPAPLKLNELGESRGTGSSSLSPPAASFSSRAWHYILVYALCSAVDLSILIELPAKVKRWEQAGEKAWEGKGRGPGSSQASGRARREAHLRYGGLGSGLSQACYLLVEKTPLYSIGAGQGQVGVGIGQGRVRPC